MKQNIENVLKDIKNKSFAPIYILSGEETFYIDQISDFIEKYLLDDTQKSFDFQVFYGKDSNVLDVLSSVKQYPILAEKRLVILREAQHLKNIEKLTSYFKTYSPTSCLVICYKGKNLDKRSSFYKNINKESVFIQSDKLYENKAFDWIQKFVKNRKRTISPKSVQLLLEKTGTDLTLIYNEVQKLLINIPEGSEITADVISKQVGILKDFTLFELQDAIAKKNAYKCQLIIKYFAKNPKNHPLTVTVSFLFSYFSKLIMLHGSTSKNEKSIAQLIGVHPFFVKDYIATASNYNLKKCVQILSFLRETDIKSKGFGNVSSTDKELLKELVFKIIHI